MNDPIQPLANRLRWLNRGILVLGLLVLLGIAVWAFIALRGSGRTTATSVVHVASTPLASASSVRRAAASAPAQAASVQQRAAAAVVAAGKASAPTVEAASHPTASAATASASVASAPAVPVAASAPIKRAALRPTASAPDRSSKAAPTGATHGTTAVAVKRRPHPTPTTDAEASSSPPHAPLRHRHEAVARSQSASDTCRTTGWYVQVGAFSQQSSIDRLTAKLRRAGYAKTCLAPARIRGLQPLYVGPYVDAAAAAIARTHLRSVTGNEGIVRNISR